MSGESTEIVTAKELAEEWKVPVKTVYLMTSQQKLPVIRFGRHFRYRRSDVAEALQHSGEVGAVA